MRQLGQQAAADELFFSRAQSNNQIIFSLKLLAKICSYFFSSASTNGKKASSFSIQAGATVPIYISTPQGNDAKHSKNAMLGQYLAGSFTIAKVIL